MTNKEELFREFDPVSTEEWEKKILQDLKGTPREKLIWKTPEGFEVRPFYRAEDLAGLEYLETLPGEVLHRGASTGQQNSWEIRQDILVGDYALANATALEALDRGATSLGFIIPDTLSVDLQGMRILLDDIYLESIGTHFITTLQALRVFDLLEEIVAEKNLDPRTIQGSIGADPLGWLALQGDYPGGTEKAFEDLATLIRKASQKMPGLRTVAINGRYFKNAGSTTTEELAFSLAMVSEYLDKLSGRALTSDEISRAFRLNLSSGAVYFMEIAKLRAARVLYAKLVEAWNPVDKSLLRCSIHTSTSEWNQTVYDPYVNVLRGATEAMSAVIGGADSVTVTPFDHAFRPSTIPGGTHRPQHPDHPQGRGFAR